MHKQSLIHKYRLMIVAIALAVSIIYFIREYMLPRGYRYIKYIDGVTFGAPDREDYTFVRWSGDGKNCPIIVIINGVNYIPSDFCDPHSQKLSQWNKHMIGVDAYFLEDSLVTTRCYYYNAVFSDLEIN